MKQTRSMLVFVFLLWVFPPHLFADFPAGPLEVKNQFPLFFYLNSPSLESPAIRDAFSIQGSYSSIFFLGDSPHWSVHMDMEWAEINFKYQKALTNSLEMSLELPILSFYGGFMDNGLEWYHTSFGFPDYGRRTRPANQFLYQIKRDNLTVIEGIKDRIGLGDLRFAFKKVLIRMDQRPFLSLKATVELPTGNSESGFGNGSPDLGLSMQLEKKIGDYLQATGNLGWVFPGPLKALETVELNNYWFGGIGMEIKLWPRMSGLVQLSAQTSPYPETGLEFIDKPACLISLGGRYHRDRTLFELSLTEDLNTTGAPDFTINISVRKNF